jgi:hypothetical protein
MKKKWEVAQINICSTGIPTDEYNLLIDEWAEVVYSHFCQLSQDHSAAPATLTSSSTESAGA